MERHRNQRRKRYIKIELGGGNGRMKKRFLTIALIIILLSTCLFALTACNTVTARYYNISSNKVVKTKSKGSFYLPIQSLNGWTFLGYIYDSDEYKNSDHLSDVEYDYRIEKPSIYGYFYFNSSSNKLYLAPVFIRPRASFSLVLLDGSTETLVWYEYFAKYKKYEYKYEENGSIKDKLAGKTVSTAGQGFFTQSDGGTRALDNNFNLQVPFESVIGKTLYQRAIYYNVIFRYSTDKEEMIILNGSDVVVPLDDPVAPYGYSFDGWYIENTSIKINGTKSVDALLNKLTIKQKSEIYNTIILFPKFKEVF
jgi:hypothetical protein